MVRSATLKLSILLFLLNVASESNAQQSSVQFEFAPYFKLSSTKAIEPNPSNKAEEDFVTKQREEMGIRALLRTSRIFGIEASVGQSTLKVTEKTRFAKDEFDQIDFVEDLNMDTSDPDRDVYTEDQMNVARFGTFIDPSFSIFMVRAAAGVQATQRKFKLGMADAEGESLTTPWKYDPYATVGVGVRFSPAMYAMAEYGFHFYKFPDLEPFSREATISFAIAIGD